jgi:hypothetical protein
LAPFLLKPHCQRSSIEGTKKPIRRFRRDRLGNLSCRAPWRRQAQATRSRPHFARPFCKVFRPHAPAQTQPPRNQRNSPRSFFAKTQRKGQNPHEGMEWTPIKGGIHQKRRESCAEFEVGYGIRHAPSPAWPTEPVCGAAPWRFTPHRLACTQGYSKNGVRRLAPTPATPAPLWSRSSQSGFHSVSHKLELWYAKRGRRAPASFRFEVVGLSVPEGLLCRAPRDRRVR